MEKSLNTIKAHHINYTNQEKGYVPHAKEYIWHIPKILREENIQKGDIVLVKSAQGKSFAIVTDVFREDIEDTGLHYKSVKSKLNKSEIAYEAILSSPRVQKFISQKILQNDKL